MAAVYKVENSIKIIRNRVMTTGVNERESRQQQQQTQPASDDTSVRWRNGSNMVVVINQASTRVLEEDEKNIEEAEPALLVDEESGSTDSKSSDENVERGNWTGQLDFLFSCLSYAVGLGNLWRFPYLCYRNGGGAFLIPYTIMLIFTGLPLFFLELSFGQYASSGVVSIWKVCPLLQGVGWGMFIVSTLIGLYYNMIVAWTIFYLFSSFTHALPWASCDNHWNTRACSIYDSVLAENCTKNNGTFYNHTCYDDVGGLQLPNVTVSPTDVVGPSDEFFHNFVLDLSEGMHDFGSLRWQPALCLLLAWAIVGLCLIRGIKTSGKAVYFTALFPYAVLIILLIRGVTLPGYGDGVLYYITPQWDRLLTAKVWGDAAVQIFFSLSPCWGGLITLASYNKFNNNCLRDSLVVSIANCATSVFAGFVIFGIIGFMAHELGVAVGDVAKQGAGLAFIVYPEAVTKLPFSPLWAVLFFSMLLTLGLGTQMTIINTVHTTLLDQFPRLLRKGYRPQILLLIICTCLFLIGLIFCSEAGMYVVQLMDNYAATYSVLILGFTECIALMWIYGVDNFYEDVELMLQRPLSKWWKYCWRYITPAFIFIILIFTWIDFHRSTYDEYQFPIFADVLGWLVSLLSIIPLPIVAIYKIYKAGPAAGTIRQRVFKLSRPTEDWGPALKKHRRQRQLSLATVHESQLPLRFGSVMIKDQITPEPKRRTSSEV